MEIKITGYVEVTLKDKDGNIVAQDCGYNDVTEMSNNILMDAIHPRLGSTGSATDVDGRTTATAQTAEPRGMTANDDDITGSEYVGPAGASTNTSTAHGVNTIAFIAVGRTDTATNADFTNMADTDYHSSNGHGAFTQQGDAAGDCKYIKRIQSVTFPTAKSIKFTTQFGTGEGNLSTNITEIGIWTAGSNTDVNGFVNDTNKKPSAITDMRLFARRVLQGDGITKTNDGTLDISYTITFSA